MISEQRPPVKNGHYFRASRVVVVRRFMKLCFEFYMIDPWSRFRNYFKEFNFQFFVFIFLMKMSLLSGRGFDSLKVDLKKAFKKIFV